MLLYLIQKTANFQHNKDNALNAHSIVISVCNTVMAYLVGLVSLYVVWVWQYL